jgi:hypothetical protein
MSARRRHHWPPGSLCLLVVDSDTPRAPERADQVPGHVTRSPGPSPTHDHAVGFASSSAHHHAPGQPNDATSPQELPPGFQLRPRSPEVRVCHLLTCAALFTPPSSADSRQQRRIMYHAASDPVKEAFRLSLDPRYPS